MNEKDALFSIETMKVVIKLAQFFKAEGIDPAIAIIAAGKFVAISHSMYSETAGNELHETFITAIREDYRNARNIKDILLEHPDEGRKV